jgi:hypothetical protein
MHLDVNAAADRSFSVVQNDAEQGCADDEFPVALPRADTTDSFTRPAWMYMTEVAESPCR